MSEAVRKVLFFSLVVTRVYEGGFRAPNPWVIDAVFGPRFRTSTLPGGTGR